MALLSPLIGYLKRGPIAEPKTKADGLAMQVSGVSALIAAPPVRLDPVEKASPLERVGRSTDFCLGQTKIRMVGQRATVNRKRLLNASWRRPETPDEHGQRKGGITVAERVQAREKLVLHVARQTVRSNLARWREGPADVPQTSPQSWRLQEQKLNSGHVFPFGR